MTESVLCFAQVTTQSAGWKGPLSQANGMWKPIKRERVWRDWFQLDWLLAKKSQAQRLLALWHGNRGNVSVTAFTVNGLYLSPSKGSFSPLLTNGWRESIAITLHKKYVLWWFLSPNGFIEVWWSNVQHISFALKLALTFTFLNVG